MKPLNYNLQFEPNLKTFVFQAMETMTFEITKPTDSMTLDSVDLIIESCELKNSDYKISGFKNEKNELIVRFDGQLQEGTYQLIIKFQGELKNNLTGFYRSRVETSDTEEYIATTQFEPADARQAFPCIDHPSYKALFDITMIVDSDLIALSNTVIKKEELLPNRKKKFIFETTPYMSTYLLYFAVGKFEILEQQYKNIQIRGIATHGKAQHTKFALDCAQKSLEFFEEYFKEPYPLKKLDLLAIPDFAAGAMENWGAITFRENLVLFYDESSSIGTKQRIAEVVAHEVAHQWFGNLVTMKWWDDLWLNESFATFMAYKVIDHYWPEWNIWTDYVLGTVFKGMKLDSLQSSHPIHVEVTDVAETTELFDEIAYDKGGSILRMIEGYLGDTSFRDGLRIYIQKFKYTNTEARDLWGCLEESSKKPIKNIMDSQINQTGFPYVTITTKGETVQLQQSRFLLKDNTNNTDIWNLPMTITLSDKTLPILVDKKAIDIQIESNFLYVNENYNSFFISNYSDDLLQSVGNELKRLSEIEKLGLIHDMDSLLFAGKKNLTELTTFLTTYFSDEKTPIVLLYTVETLNKIYLLLKDEKVGDLLQKNAKRGITVTGYDPAKNEHPYITHLRTVSLFALSLFDDEDVKKFAEEKFSAYIKDEKSLHPDLRTVVYSLAVWYYDANYDIIMSLYQQSNKQEEKINYLTALGSSRNKALIDKSFQFALSENVRFNQLLYIIYSTTTNPYAKDLTLDWLFNHWNDLKVKSGGTISHIFRRLLQVIIPNCATGRVAEAKSFIQTINTAELTKTFDQVLEELQINAAFIAKSDTRSIRR